MPANVQTDTENKIPTIDDGVDRVYSISFRDGLVGDVTREWLAGVAFFYGFRSVLRLGDRPDDRG
jgi:hypothetical protein